MTHPTDPPTDLEGYRWRRRPLLLFAPDRDHPPLRRQRALLAGREDDATDLDTLFAQIDAMPMRVREMREAEG